MKREATREEGKKRLMKKVREGEGNVHAASWLSVHEETVSMAYPQPPLQKPLVIHVSQAFLVPSLPFLVSCLQFPINTPVWNMKVNITTMRGHPIHSPFSLYD